MFCLLISRCVKARRSLLLLLCLLVALSAPAQAATLTLQPTEATSADVMLYEFLSTSNFDDFQFGPNNFGKILSVAKTAGSGHDIRSLLQFDLGATGLIYPGQVQSAVLKLRTVDANSLGFPISNPSTTNFANVDIYQALGPWGETTVSWGTQPAAGAKAIATAKVTGINQTISFTAADFTSAVQGWVNNPAGNYGLLLDQRDATFVASTNKYVGVVFASSNYGSNQPLLEITLTPDKPGDANFDGVVDGGDYTIWANNFLQSPRSFAQGDFTGDGLVDGADYTVWANNFAPLGLTALAVPEPASVVLIMGGFPALLLWARRSRHRRTNI